MPIDVGAFSTGRPIRAADHAAVATEVLRVGNISVINLPGAPILHVKNTPGGVLLSIAPARESMFIGRQTGTGPNAEAAYAGSDPRAWVRELYIADDDGDTDDGIDWQLAPCTGSGDGRWATASKLASTDVVVFQGWDQQSPPALRYFYASAQEAGFDLIKITTATGSLLGDLYLDGGTWDTNGGAHYSVVDLGTGTVAVGEVYPARLDGTVYKISSLLPLGLGGDLVSVGTVVITGTSPLEGSISGGAARTVTDLGNGAPSEDDEFPCLYGSTICVIVSHTAATVGGIAKIVTGGEAPEGDLYEEGGGWDTNGGSHYTLIDAGAEVSVEGEAYPFMQIGAERVFASITPPASSGCEFVKIISDTEGALTGDLFTDLTGSSPNWDTNGGAHYSVIDIGVGCAKADGVYPGVQSGSYYVISTQYFLLKDDE